MHLFNAFSEKYSILTMHMYLILSLFVKRLEQSFVVLILGEQLHHHCNPCMKDETISLSFVWSSAFCLHLRDVCTMIYHQPGYVLYIPLSIYLFMCIIIFIYVRMGWWMNVLGVQVPKRPAEGIRSQGAELDDWVTTRHSARVLWTSCSASYPLVHLSSPCFGSFILEILLLRYTTSNITYVVWMIKIRSRGGKILKRNGETHSGLRLYY